MRGTSALEDSPLKPPRLRSEARLPVGLFNVLIFTAEAVRAQRFFGILCVLCTSAVSLRGEAEDRPNVSSLKSPSLPVRAIGASAVSGYNTSAMPTPVNHLVMAREAVESGLLSPAVRDLLEREWGAFLLGHTAPDVQTVSGQPRHATHFYTLPPTGETPAHRVLLSAYPQLARASRLASDHAAFVAGYLVHLLVDERWWREVFNPCFGPEATWGTFRERLFLHNVLRTWLDLQDQKRLDGGEAAALVRVEPHGWLPFVDDESLRAWRDLLVEQLRPGRAIRTAEVFAARMRVPTDLVQRALDSPEAMARIFRHAPRSLLQAYRTEAVRRSADLLNCYLSDV